MDKLDTCFPAGKFDERVIRERCIDFDTETWIQKEILAMMGELVELLRKQTEVVAEPCRFAWKPSRKSW